MTTLKALYPRAEWFFDFVRTHPEVEELYPVFYGMEDIHMLSSMARTGNLDPARLDEILTKLEQRLPRLARRGGLN